MGELGEKFERAVEKLARTQAEKVVEDALDPFISEHVRDFCDSFLEDGIFLGRIEEQVRSLISADALEAKLVEIMDEVIGPRLRDRVEAHFN